MQHADFFAEAGERAFQNLHLGFRGGRLRRDQVRRSQNDAQAWAVYVGKEPRGKLRRVQRVNSNRLNAAPCADLFGVSADLPRKIEQTGIGLSLLHIPACSLS